MMTTSNTSSNEIMDLGISYLIEKLGTVDTERFISTILREKSDYTKWRARYFPDLSSPLIFTDVSLFRILIP